MHSESLTGVEKTMLAGFVVTYETNLAQAKKYPICSLQAATALGEIIQFFWDKADRPRNEKEFFDLVNRFQNATRTNFVPMSQELEGKKLELKQRLEQLKAKNNKHLTRLRKVKSL
jgi:hypothetical protein